MAVQEKARRIIEHVHNTFSPSNPATIRRIYYSLVTAGILPSCVESYNCVKVTMTTARRSGAISYATIIDNCREASVPAQWNSIADRAEGARFIRLNRWQNQPTVCEIIIEKDAAQALIESACDPAGITIRCLRGDASLSFLYTMANFYADKLNEGKAVRIGAWADFDAGGVSILKAAERGVREILSNQFGIEEPDMQWTRLGINKDQFIEYNMLPIPMKKADTKAAAFVKEFGVKHGAEIDALPAGIITKITKTFIEGCKDQKQWKRDDAFYTSEEARWTAALESVAL